MASTEFATKSFGREELRIEALDATAKSVADADADSCGVSGSSAGAGGITMAVGDAAAGVLKQNCSVLDARETSTAAISSDDIDKAAGGSATQVGASGEPTLWQHPIARSRIVLCNLRLRQTFSKNLFVLFL